MNEIFDRISIRVFSEEEVSSGDIEKLVNAGMSAPSSKNVRPWQFYVVKNKEVLEELSTAAPNAGPIKNAPLGIVVCGDTSKEFRDYLDINLSAATQNILLEATSLDLGAVWLGIRPKDDRVKKVSEILKLDDNIMPFSMIALGHKTKEYKKKDRFDETKIHYIF